MAAATVNKESYNRAKDVKEFDESKTGVKGLVDSGITTIPRFFVHPPETLTDLIRPSSTTLLIPTIDLAGVDSDLRSKIVENIACASRELGFFQIINHGIKVEVMEHMIGAIKGFHEQPAEIKAQLYRREMNLSVAYGSNFDLFRSKAASWRDTLQIKLSPTVPELDEIPERCRDAVLEWDRNVTKLGELLLGLLCEGLGVETGRLKEMTFLEGRAMVAHYYPFCPQPDLTVGTTSHTDPGILTILVQDQRGGLQVKCGEEWVNVKPVPGALVVNVGDIFQIISNDEYKSVEHRVLANPFREPRISAAVFFNTSDRNNLYGPLPELVSLEKPARFRQFDYTEFMTKFFTKELGGESLINFYRL